MLTDRLLVRQAKHMAWVILGVAAASVFLALGLAFVPGAFPAVSQQTMILALLAVGLCTCAGGFAAPDFVALRVLRHQFLTLARSLMVIVTWFGFAVGYLIAGDGASLFTGFLVAALAYLTCVVLPARQLYARVE